MTVVILICQAKLNEWLVAVDGLLINDSFEKLANFNLSAPMSAAIVDFVDALCGTKKPEYENIDKEKVIHKIEIV